MDDAISRRTLLIGGVAFAVGGCARRGSQREGATPARVSPRPAPGRPVTSLSGGAYYEVARGDTLSAISRRTGIPLQTIIDANRLGGTELQPGTRLWLPGATQVQVDGLTLRRPTTVEQPAPREAPEPEPEPEPDIGPVGPAGYVLVPRSKWTNARIAGNHNLMNGVSRLTLHHTGEHAGLAGLPDIEVVRRIERYHRNEKRWAAIGYHFLVGKDGRIYEGRPVKYQGAHVSGDNTHNIGISVIGDFSHHLPNARQLVALTAFLDDGRRRWRLTKRHIYGHRDLNASVCPGNALYAWLKRYKQA